MIGTKPYSTLTILVITDCLLICILVEDAQDCTFIQGRFILQESDDALSFDKKLRLLMFNEIEKIEIAIRRAVMQ